MGTLYIVGTPIGNLGDFSVFVHKREKFSYNFLCTLSQHVVYFSKYVYNILFR